MSLFPLGVGECAVPTFANAKSGQMWEDLLCGYGGNG